MADDGLSLPVDKFVDAFGRKLQHPRLLHAKAGAHRQKEEHQQRKRDQFEREGIGDRRPGLRGMHADQQQQRVDRSGEQVIQVVPQCVE